MRAWAMLLGGLLVWAAHFFSLYIGASLFPGTATARWLAIVATLAAAAAAGWLLSLSIRQSRHAEADELQRWLAGFAAAGCGLALLAIFYQGLPALLG